MGPCASDFTFPTPDPLLGAVYGEIFFEAAFVDFFPLSFSFSLGFVRDKSTVLLVDFRFVFDRSIVVEVTFPDFITANRYPK